MRKSIYGTVFFCLTLLTGCASTPVVTIPPDWGYEKDAINLQIKADRQLNLFRKTPHTLLLCIYHLRDPNWFNQLQNEKDGLQKLLECGRSDPTVVQARQFVVQPGQELIESLDRPEGAKYVSIAAGYYKMQKENVTRSFSIPLIEEKLGSNLVQKIGKLSLRLDLGPQGILPAQELAPGGR